MELPDNKKEKKVSYLNRPENYQEVLRALLDLFHAKPMEVYEFFAEVVREFNEDGVTDYRRLEVFHPLAGSQVPIEQTPYFDYAGDDSIVKKINEKFGTDIKIIWSDDNSNS